MFLAIRLVSLLITANFSNTKNCRRVVLLLLAVY
jgi:hypothetical protein